MRMPARLSDSNVPLAAAPLLGQHTDAVLADDLGLDERALESLRCDGVIG
jgi:crotonobetainyl-CoA:carnitine CoA-transferase CaiB-like acyl-CoA transferase